MTVGRLLTTLAVVAACLVPVAATAQEPEMSAEDMAKMQEIMASYGTPGPEHEAMEPLVGTFEYTSSFWMMPDSEPGTDSGTTEYVWTHGGRYITHETRGTAMGMPFTGTGIMGFDRYNGEYFSFWIDSMSTMPMTSRGHADESGKVITFEGTMDDIWMDQKDVWVKSVLTIHGPDSHSLSMYVKGPDGNEFKNFEVDYTRSKMAEK